MRLSSYVFCHNLHCVDEDDPLFAHRAQDHAAELLDQVEDQMEQIID